MLAIMALLDMIGVASILPFMAVASNPNFIETNFILKLVYQKMNIFGVNNDRQFLFFLGIIVFLLLLISLAFKAFVTYLQAKFIHMREYSLSKRLVKIYITQPYLWFLNRHSADLGKTILSEVNTIITAGLNGLFEIAAKGMLIIAIIILLLIVDPKMAITVGFSLSVAYGLIYLFVRNNLNQLGAKRLHNNELRFTTVSEAFGAVKEIKIGGLENSYIGRFSKPAYIYSQTTAIFIAIANLPRFFFRSDCIRWRSINNAIHYVTKW